MCVVKQFKSNLVTVLENLEAIAQLHAELCLVKVEKFDAYLRPFANPVPYNIHLFQPASNSQIHYLRNFYMFNATICIKRPKILGMYFTFSTIIRSYWTLGEMRVTHKMCLLQCSIPYQQHRKVMSYVHTL